MTMFGAAKRRNSLSPSYDTPLTPAQENAFLRWQSQLPSNLQATQDYDLHGAYLGAAAQAGNGHLPDTWKKPNHMTFSDESQYSTPEHQGGQWVGRDGKWIFVASPWNMNQNGSATILDYFRQNEPAAWPLLPINYSLPRGAK